VVTILTAQNAPKLHAFPAELGAKGTPADTRLPLQDNLIFHQGEHLGAVIAESLEAAREGAAAVKVNYEIATPKVDLIAEQLRAIRPEIWGGRVQLQAKKREPDIVWVNAPSEHKTEFDYSTLLRIITRSNRPRPW
jgi:xanthine dehydrogenase YagR molybdenum-binding subunit